MSDYSDCTFSERSDNTQDNEVQTDGGYYPYGVDVTKRYQSPVNLDLLPPTLTEVETAKDLIEELKLVEERFKLAGYDADEATNELVTNIRTREELIVRVNHMLGRFKASVRYDIELYRLLAELVHLRIRANGVSFAQWLDSCKLTTECRMFLLTHTDAVLDAFKWFREEYYASFSRIGLQSALKYESFYLARLGEDKQETIPQFFARLAAEATRGTMKTTALMAALRGDKDSLTAQEVFLEYFKHLCMHRIVPSSPAMCFFGRDVSAYASCYLLAPELKNTHDAMTFLAREVIPHINNRGGMGIGMQSFNFGDTESRASLVDILKALDSLTLASNATSERPTSACVYVEPWHSEINKLLTIRGTLAANEETRCDNVFTALWMPDLFFKRFMTNPDAQWTLFGQAGNHLMDLYGADFEREYCRLERAGFGVETIPVRDLMYKIVRSAVATGTPFIMMKDACNRHYFADMRGRALKCSNLCTEIVHMADEDLNGVCNLMSINLAAFTRQAEGNPLQAASFDYEGFRRAVRLALVFVNVMINEGKMPTRQTTEGNRTLRSVGLGLQGLHTSCLMQHLDMTSDEGIAFSTRVTELLALESMTVSCQLCEFGLPPFTGFDTSYYASGRLHMDGWPNALPEFEEEWDALRKRIMRSGLYNCQTVAMMPTVSSSQVTEVSEGVSPLFSNLFSKISLSGEEIRVNSFLMDTLVAMYPEKTERLKIMKMLDRNGWSIRAAFGNLHTHDHLAKFVTAFEVDQKRLLRLCFERAPFVDHSQSTTLYITENKSGAMNASTVAELLTTAYKYGLKTAMYYCKVKKVTNNGLFTGSCGDEVVCSACQ